MDNNRKVLYISYNGLLEEIAPSQIIPYLHGLTREGYRFVLLTFEKPQKLKEVGRAGLQKLKKKLDAAGIEWYWLRYHKRMSLLATSFDVISGAVYALWLMFIRRIRIVHARSVVPATMSLISKCFGAKFIFDTRGLLAEEYVGGGQWKEGGLKYRVVKFFEKVSLQLTDAIIVLTPQHRQYLSNYPYFKDKYNRIKVEVIPCCVDLARFKHDYSNAPMIRRSENLQDNFIFLYPGKIGAHYMLEEMLDFFVAALTILPRSKFVILTQDDKGRITEVASRKLSDLGKLSIKRPSFEEIPSLLSIADTGIFFINPYKKFGSFPIKLGEFLSCGIPVVINKGVGNTEEFVKTNRVGVVIEGFDTKSYTSAVYELLELLKEKDALGLRCRATAERYLSLEIGIQKYNTIYNGVYKCTQ